MKESIKLLRNILLAFCCITTLTCGVFVAANFSHVQKFYCVMFIFFLFRNLCDRKGTTKTAHMQEISQFIAKLIV